MQGPAHEVPMANVLVINLTIYISLILEMLQSKNDNNCPVVFKAKTFKIVNARRRATTSSNRLPK